ncbi:hypothetical protein C8R48DRAFT_698508 [Suillus tomentosus]|nr:hypothetical protein C8R48DRAFT_698508 [Suillus tomentosus]
MIVLCLLHHVWHVVVAVTKMGNTRCSGWSRNSGVCVWQRRVFTVTKVNTAYFLKQRFYGHMPLNQETLQSNLNNLNAIGEWIPMIPPSTLFGYLISE